MEPVITGGESRSENGMDSDSKRGATQALRQPPRAAALEELRGRRQWLVYELKKKIDKATRRTKFDKVPVNFSGFASDPHSPNTWTSYAEARKHAARLSSPNGRTFGVGFDLTAGDPWCALDLDHCIDPATRQVDQWAIDIVRQFASYCEHTPSGEGLRIWVRGMWKGDGNKFPVKGARHPDAKIEVYSERHYFTVTEDPYQNLPITDAQEELDALAKHLAPTPVETPQPVKQPESTSARPLPVLNLRQWLERYNVLFGKEKHRRGGTVVYEVPCGGTHGNYPADDGKGYVGQKANGALFAGCQHSSCSWFNGDGGNHWEEFRARYEPGYRPYRERSAPPDDTLPPPSEPADTAGANAGIDWRDLLILGKKGKPLAVLANVITALTYADEWHELLRFNQFTSEVVTTRETQWKTPVGSIWTDTDDSRAAAWLQRQEGILASSKTVAEAVQVVARDRAFHPVREYLEGQVWDKTKRIDNWLTVYLGVRDNEYTRAVGCRWLISAVARIHKPGCQADHVLLLDGDQGILKSTALRTLTGDEWFAARLSELGSKDSCIEVLGKWIIEMSELPNLRGVALERFKAFITERYDRFRPPYGRRTVEHPRQCVLAASSNNREPFIDPTGTRRIWPVRCTQIDVAALARDRDQLWAEALCCFLNGEAWWLDTAELTKLAEAEQDDYYEPGVWDSIIADWIENPVQREAPEGYGPNQVNVPVTPWEHSEPGKVSITDILVHAIGKDKDRLTQADRNQISRCLQRFKWESKQDRTRGINRGKRFYYKPSS